MRAPPYLHRDAELIAATGAGRNGMSAHVRWDSGFQNSKPNSRKRFNFTYLSSVNREIDCGGRLENTPFATSVSTDTDG